MAVVTFCRTHFPNGLGFRHDLILVHFGHAICSKESGMGKRIENKVHVNRASHPSFYSGPSCR